MNELGAGLAIAATISSLVFILMMKVQENRQRQADRAFRTYLKSKGIDPDLKEK